MIVTIDGPAGSGKSTVARQLAVRMDIAYLDTGAMYRTVGLAAIQERVPLDDGHAICALIGRMEMDIGCTPSETRIRLHGKDVSREIRTMSAGGAAGAVAVLAPVRLLLIERQRAIAARLGSLVADGRDQGSVVFPDADAKFLITASPECRARRRFAELKSDGQLVTMDQVLADVRRRDATDQIQWQTLLQPGSAVQIDTTDLSLEQVVDRLLTEVRRRI
ncbi:MAG: (d)CMP kinase [Phycisphaerales bacterium]|nr:(d)CMP kinase [Phycisphaerales bacterium]